MNFHRLAVFCVCWAVSSSEMQRPEDDPDKDALRYDGFVVLEMTLTSDLQVKLLTDLKEEVRRKEEHGTTTIEEWTGSINKERPFSLLLAPKVAPDVLMLCHKEGIQYEIVWNDLQSVIDLQNAEAVSSSKTDRDDGIAAQTSGMTWARYHRYSTIERYILALPVVHPDLVTIERLGLTYEGRQVWVVKLGKPRSDGIKKPAIWLDAGIHAREWISSATVTFMLNELVTKYTSDPIIRRLVDQVDFYVVPMVNPDGFEFTHQKERLFRKTRRVNPFNACIGVDANRNYDFQWQTERAELRPCEITFGGDFPYSEPENRALFEKVLDLKGDLKSFITFHSHSQLWMLPYGYTFDLTPDDAVVRDLAVNATNALRALYGTVFRVGTSPEILYTSSGTSRDFAKGRTQIKYVYTVELRDTGEFGFLLPAEQILPSGLETFEGVKVIALRIIEEFARN
ncbi:Carboxypeptidase B [Hypsibius exemplaris]|uniref:Carboxypeptidase B n=1 Tax=Hypsibius exemplaris TaxID=2072580 RepID=A0A9X6NFP5_HYPEX|nr:Carboxypeptidase B [Hypsibius exemplaris]